ncbi:hypothetical protein SO802_018744 [Lithocarpus litseifolius]|uniref:Uncharacterized protein n=1 Tax=Lithocarpus litseifolius TaxID=425828 RepID=A0AAW2CM54_9ROSI
MDFQMVSGGFMTASIADYVTAPNASSVTGSVTASIAGSVTGSVSDSIAASRDGSCLNHWWRSGVDEVGCFVNPRDGHGRAA